MTEKIFFQSSLPRSGSTLLQNIIGQNPEFYVTPTSGVLELLYAARGNYTNSPEFKAQNPDRMKAGWISFCNAGLKGFFEGVTDKRYVVDKSRGWGVHYGFLNSFYPEPKIICVVRDLRAVFASMEKNFRNSQDKDSGLVNHSEMKGTTTEKRIDTWANSQPVGMAIERLKQMILDGTKEKVHFVRFEDLTKDPRSEMTKIYKHLGVEEYEHDFDNIKQITKEDDSVYGIYGDHTIRTRVEQVTNDYHKVLGPHASDWIKDNYAWFFKEFKYY